MDLYNYGSYYSDYATSGSDPSSSIFSLIISILTLIGLWKVFEKAGEAGWKAIIPVYNAYILFKIAEKSFWKYFIVALVFTICISVAAIGTIMKISGYLGGNSSVGSIDWGTIAAACAFLSLVFGIWLIVLNAGLCEAISRKFGHGSGFAAGLFFLAPIFYMILGFSSDQYVGKSSEVTQTIEGQQ